MSATAQEPIMASIVAYLLASGPIAAAFTSRIYDNYAAQDQALPLAFVSFVTDPPQNYLDAVDDLRMEFQVDVYGKYEAGPSAVRTNADLIYARLHRAVSMTSTGYSAISIICTDRGGGVDLDFIVGGRTQQDGAHILQQYRLLATGS